mmetsp:Transcript_753/g.1502  ORF Transcript_753/g.1502 Transcript_753/m.1502 type:complete len:94 (+) Transcript_753:5504-5785(+)
MPTRMAWGPGEVEEKWKFKQHVIHQHEICLFFQCIALRDPQISSPSLDMTHCSTVPCNYKNTKVSKAKSDPRTDNPERTHFLHHWQYTMPSGT